MGTNSSKTKGSVIKTKVRAVGRMSLVRKQTSERRKEIDELKRKRGQAISVFEDSSDGDISREDITSLPLKNGGHLSDGERNEAFSVMDGSNAWDELRYSRTSECDELPKVGLCLSDFKRVTRKKTLDEIDIPFSIPYEDMVEIDACSQCHVCEVFTGHDIYPCRICGNAFHKSCLQKLARCQSQSEVDLLHSAKSVTGWTCYVCDDLTNLLTEEELIQLKEAFVKYDIEKDANVSKEDFCNFVTNLHKDLFITEMSDLEIEEEEFKFCLMDTDQKGSISWRQFLNYESVSTLKQRAKITLVPLLTVREVELARRVFHTFDIDRTGEITEADAQAALEYWYTLFYAPDGPYNGYAKLSESNQIHVNHVSSAIDEANETSGRKVKWEKYLRNQALHILAMRPNKCRIPVGEKAWLERLMLPVTRNRRKNSNFLAPDEDSRSDTSGLSSTSIEQLDIG